MSRRTSDFVPSGGLLLLVPLVLGTGWIVVYSLLYSLGGIGYLSTGWTIRFWQSAFTGGGLAGSIGLSLAVALTVTLLAALLSLALVLLAPDLHRRPAWLGLLCLPLATPVAVAALGVAQVLGSGGLISRLAYHLRLVQTPADFPVLVNDRYAIGIVVAQLCSAVPLLTLYFSQLWRTVRADRYCQLAEALGATPRQSRLRVALPLLLSRGRSMVLLVFLLTLGSFEIPLLLGRQSPQMFSVLTYRRSGLFDITRKPEAYVLASIYFVLVSALLALCLRWRQRDD